MFCCRPKHTHGLERTNRERECLRERMPCRPGPFLRPKSSGRVLLYFVVIDPAKPAKRCGSVAGGHFQGMSLTIASVASKMAGGWPKNGCSYGGLCHPTAHCHTIGTRGGRPATRPAALFYFVSGGKSASCSGERCQNPPVRSWEGQGSTGACIGPLRGPLLVLAMPLCA